ncbi:MAG TPA: SDR family oxidoreductase [Kofleriaceae bacterium]|nr:SDR family oxidoreductase [Kofleriaceae bacterium]
MSATLVTGASGYLGSLVAAALLAQTDRSLLLPVRAVHEPGAVRERIRLALGELGVPAADAEGRLARVQLVELPPIERVGELEAAARAAGVDEIAHCAGCVDYFDLRNLLLVNVGLTAGVLALARQLGVRRFTYLSTAYCAGYRTDVLPEALHPDPPADAEPTEYTRTKREAERLVAASGIPYVILRPSIVIGDSRTGHYAGKNYGLYQMWRAIDGLLTREYVPIWYTVGPPSPLNFVHEDAFQAAFMAAHQGAEDNSIIHVVSERDTCPTMRDLCWLWADVYRPREVHCYQRVDDVPLRSIPSRQRRFLELGHKNLEISAWPWRFDRGGLDRLRARGLQFAEATLESVARCQDRYVAESPRIQAYLAAHAAHTGERSVLREMEPATSPPEADRAPSTR